MYVISLSLIYNGYIKLNLLFTCFQRGFIAQLIQHHTSIVVVTDSVEAFFFFLGLLCNCLKLLHNYEDHVHFTTCVVNPCSTPEAFADQSLFPSQVCWFTNDAYSNSAAAQEGDGGNWEMVTNHFRHFAHSLGHQGAEHVLLQVLVIASLTLPS